MLIQFLVIIVIQLFLLTYGAIIPLILHLLIILSLTLLDSLQKSSYMHQFYSKSIKKDKLIDNVKMAGIWAIGVTAGPIIIKEKENN